MTDGPGRAEPMPERPDLADADPAPVFGKLFDVHARQLHRYLARRVGSETAHDLVADTFLTALRQRHTYRPESGTARSWLYGIATNLLRHHVRAEVRALHATARLAAEADGAASGHDSRVADRVDAEVRAGQLAGALAALSPTDRDTLLLVSFAGLEPAEVAHVLDVPQGTVRSRLHRVRQRLRLHAPDALRPPSTDDQTSEPEVNDRA